ncbi:hypothetical protein J2802_005592, partial [Paraburkholderia caribensis]|nr:hypothetical protein [Paraburkholderia caribensis]
MLGLLMWLGRKGLVFGFWFLVFGLSATLGGLLAFALASAVCFCFRWHPRYVSSLHASPLCGAAPTFLCRRKE